MTAHLIIQALAGTGKTTTGIEGLKVLKGQKPQITPSPQQQAIWDAFAESKGAGTIAMVAFNKSIATELQSRVPEGVMASTMHSLGFGAVTKAFGRKQVKGRWATMDLVEKVMRRDLNEIRKAKPGLAEGVCDLVSKCKMTLAGWTKGEGFNAEQISNDVMFQLISHYDIQLNGNATEAIEATRDVLSIAADGSVRKIEFDDMIWLPVIHSLPVRKNDFLFVDEAQDLNRAQQQLAKMSGKRLVFCGDVNQAIYGFAGADCEAMERLEQELGETPEGVQLLPLTETRRCSKAVVGEAQVLVPEFSAHESNGLGIVRRSTMEAYLQDVEDSDMLLCRVNAPLVQQCYRLIKQGRKANIQGRDIGKGLVTLIRKLMGGKGCESQSCSDLAVVVDDWYHREAQKESSKKFSSESKLIALEDKAKCLDALSEGCATVGEVISTIENIFSDQQGEGVLLSSIHKAKGLEAQRVFLLEPKGATVPHPMAKSQWQLKQEYNLRYVAITRAIDTLVYVSEGSK